MSFEAASYFTLNAIQLAKHFISQNDGSEIVLVGKVNESGQVYELKRAAMGNSSSVAAVINAASPGEVLIHNHPNGDVRPSHADIEVAARAAEKGIGSYIIDNSVTLIFPVVERMMPENTEVEPVNPDDVIRILGENGSLKEAFPDFEFRKPQIHMALEVTEAVNSSLVLSSEAGTGTGKSFAYLVPALLYVSKNKGKKVVISTSTIALEEQLFDKDIPFLIEKLGFNEINTAVLKGRSNYLCKRKYSLFRMENLQTQIIPSHQNRTELIHEIDTWMNQLNDGTRTTMNSSVAHDIWSEICADEFACEKSRCRHFNTCYFFKARRRANFASLILINHHLLMADISMKMSEEDPAGILPQYDILVIDEAHNIFKSAISFLGESVSTQNVIKQLNRLFNPKRSSGLLTKILDSYADPEITQSIEKAVNILSSFIPLFAHSITAELINAAGKDSEGTYELDDAEIRERMNTILEKAVISIAEITGLINPVIKKLREINENSLMKTINNEIINSLLTDISGVTGKLDGYAFFYTEFCAGKDVSSNVFWGEKDKNSTLTLTVTPLDIQKILAKQIYDPTPCVILTSATLSTGKGDSGFSFFNRESGLELSKREKRYVNLESCFDYSTQVRAFISTDMPSPVTDKELFDIESIEASKEIVCASNGGALVLFTSIGHREQAAKKMTDLDFDVICQGKFATSKIVKKFREDRNATLLATDTFWEGIDMKGDTLRNLVIVRLPFRFPSHPFVKRYVSKLEERTGQSGFKIYTLPNAILKFKQGFGRLIRTKDDIGTVTVLDKRILEQRYGREFIEAAPPGVKFTPLSSIKVAEKIREFFKKPLL
ncbi:MAG TPA: helicase C-terminal domain-containing protein [bacterium]|jgi:ATP-dependent DNA helicase DinG|nr:DEAD/DEAH box helicase family protein [bacterium]HQM83721.1 helicase C-terminal domain-containing protein [bacterium]